MVLSVFAPVALDVPSGGSVAAPPYAYATLTLRLPVALAPVEQVVLACAVSGGAGSLVTTALAPATGTPFSFLRSLDNTTLTVTATADAVTWGATIDLPLTMTPHLALRAAAVVDGTLTCTCASTPAVAPGVSRVFPRYPPSYAATLPLTVLSPALPLAYDVLLEVSPGSVRSAWGGGAPVALPYLMDSAIAGSSRNNATPASPWQSAAAVLGSPTALAALAAAATLPPPAGPNARAFTLTLSGASHLILVGQPQLLPLSSGPPFGATTVVFIGGVVAPVHWVSGDGTLLSIQTPPLGALCANADSIG